MHLLSASMCPQCLSGSFQSRYYQTIKLSLPSLQCISSVPLSALSASVVPFYPDTIGTQTLSAFAAMHLLSASQCPECLSGSSQSRYYRNSNSLCLRCNASPQCLSVPSVPQWFLSILILSELKLSNSLCPRNNSTPQCLSVP